MVFELVRRTVRIAVRALLRPGQIPGYEQRGWLDRQHLNVRALGLFCRSASCWRLTAWTLAWWLLAANIVWHFDLSRWAADRLLLAPLLWLLPACALARRRCINRLLGPHWPLD